MDEGFGNGRAPRHADEKKQARRDAAGPLNRARVCRGCGQAFAWERQVMICTSCLASKHLEDEKKKSGEQRMQEARSQAVQNRFRAEDLKVSDADAAYPLPVRGNTIACAAA